MVLFMAQDITRHKVLDQRMETVLLLLLTLLLI